MGIIAMIQPNTLYELTVAKTSTAYELTAAPVEDTRKFWGPWQFKSVEEMATALSRLDMSAIDYTGVDQRLKATSSVQVGHPIRGSLLLQVLGAVKPLA
jgi:hypothetical protein